MHSGACFSFISLSILPTVFLLFVAEFLWLCSLYQHGCGLVPEGVDGMSKKETFPRSTQVIWRSMAWRVMGETGQAGL